MADEREILTPQQAAEFLQVPVLTVQRQAKAGRLPGGALERSGASRARACLSGWAQARRHDLELFNRKSDREEQTSEGEDDEAEAE
jgi:hypothetical protein